MNGKSTKQMKSQRGIAMMVALLAADKFCVSERKVAIAAVNNAIFRRLRILGQHLAGTTHPCAYLPRA